MGEHSLYLTNQHPRVGSDSCRGAPKGKKLKQTPPLKQNNLANILDSMEDGVYIINQWLEIEYANPAFEAIFGPVKIGQNKCYQHFHNRKDPCPWCPNEAVFAGKTMRWEWYFAKNKRTYDLITTPLKIPLKNTEGNISKLGIFRDITEHKKTDEEIRESREQLRNLSAHLHSVREEERKLMAREIHDELGQSLTALKMDLAWLTKRLPKDKKPLLEKADAMSGLVDRTIRTVQRVCTQLRPGILDDFGLVTAIEWQADEFVNRTGIKCRLSPKSKHIVVDGERATAIFRVFQEILTNVVRHAKATEIKVGLRQKNSKLVLQVKDNGIGIKEEQIIDSKSLGLIGIRERVYYLGGKVEISGIQGKGTTVTITMPLNDLGRVND
jgi:signal transduction histidine kinase